MASFAATPLLALLAAVHLQLQWQYVSASASASASACTTNSDVVVWGGTVCGLTASVAVHRTDPALSIVWLVNGTRLGGMTSGGLGGVDRSMNIGGLAAELMLPLGRGFEPHTAEAAMENMLATAGSSVKVRRKTGWIASVAATGSEPRRITSVTTLDGNTYCGAVFIDCSYEGDLARLSGTAFAVGRESAAEYNETFAGDDGGFFNHTDMTEKLSWFNSTVSPWTDASNTTLLPTIDGIAPSATTPPGAGDDRVMSMCFRMCLTNSIANAIPLTAPPGYTASALELLRREIVAATGAGIKLSLTSMFLVRELSNNKIDLNSGQWSTEPGGGGFFPFSTDLPFAQHGWPLGDAPTRARIFEAHKWWTQALLYYLGNDPHLRKIQPALSAEMKSFGRCADEYAESPDRWTPQLYVRESIRLRGAKVLTQADVCNPTPSPTGVGLSKWGVDIHAVRRVAGIDPETGDWRVYNTGGRDSGRQHVASCPSGLVEVPYEALTPEPDDTANLLVPVCVSSTHVAFATYRLESQYAVFGHSSGTAAALALGASRSAPTVQQVNVTELRARLVQQHQIITAGAPPPSPAGPQGWGCAPGMRRCIGMASGGRFANATCSTGDALALPLAGGAPACAPLAADEWLAHNCCGMWQQKMVGGKQVLVALKSTYLKKSTLDSSRLPATEKRQVSAGAECTIVGDGKSGSAFQDYVLCTVATREW